MSNLERIGEATYRLPKEGKMLVPGLVIATEKLLQEMEIEKPLEQVRNVATLPGIVGYSIAMPDIHWGYGFPIGGVAAMCAESGVISPGGVGYDINCGVRLALVNLPWESLKKEQKLKLLKTLFHHIPSGVGGGHKNGKKLTDADYREIVKKGALFALEHGYGLLEDLEHIESKGCLDHADLHAVSQTAKNRGALQLGTLGSGNHFIEIGAVGTIYDPTICQIWGINKGDTYILIHSGSRGFGHQICQDTLDSFQKLGFAKGLVDKQLIAAPISSEPGKQYFAAMAAAANFAFNNRQMMLHMTRKAFKEVLQIPPNKIRLLYDVCHNIAKFETHEINGKMKKLLVHRKGATRSFGPGAEELAPLYQKTGQPVLVPGDMGRASHLLAGLGNPLTFCSCCHGAGRSTSRIQSHKKWAGHDPVQHMEEQGVHVMATSKGTISEEMPDAYKDVDAVASAVHEAKLAKMVARLRPHLVIKG